MYTAGQRSLYAVYKDTLIKVAVSDVTAAKMQKIDWQVPKGNLTYQEE